MEEKFTNFDYDFKDIEEEISTKKRKLNKYIVLIPIMPIIVTPLIFFLILFSLDKTIKKKCEIGEEDKCMKCENNICISCNPKYDLINGKCKESFSINATYQSTTDNETIYLINSDYKKHFIKMEIDEKIVLK